MKANHAIMAGLVLVAICGSLLGQTPPTGDAAPGPASGAATAQSPQPAGPSAIKANDSGYVIGNDDLLTINVWKEAEVSRSLPVRSDGKISLPLVGEVQAAGRTPLQLEEEISNKLRNYITDPEVTVMVQQINSERYNILGQVAKPGSYSLALTTSVLDAIATAGGFRDFAKKKGIYILRRNSAGGQTRISFNYQDVIKGKSPEQDIRLQPNDTVVVP
jgi:polysaccharide export outer membrane protein